MPGPPIDCVCPDESLGEQFCNELGGYDECICAPAGTSSGGADDDGNGEESDTGLDLCGNGFEDPGECGDEPTSPCPEDCGGGSDSTTGSMACTVYGGLVANVPSQWGFMGLMGFAAGNAMCTDAGFHHVCDYEELLVAEMQAEFGGVAAGTTIWVHRDTPAMVGVAMSQHGPGGRCVDWTYGTNHIADGEYATFGAGGAITFSLDNDTFYDGVDGTHTIPNQLQCGNEMRAVPCCNDCGL